MMKHCWHNFISFIIFLIYLQVIHTITSQDKEILRLNVKICEFEQRNIYFTIK